MLLAVWGWMASVVWGGAVESTKLGSFELADQFGTTHRVEFPKEQPVLLLVGDRKGSEEVDAWVGPLKAMVGGGVAVVGIADVRDIPGMFRSRITGALRKQRTRPVLLDFDGVVTERLRVAKKVANLYVVDGTGKVMVRVEGMPDEAKLGIVRAALKEFVR